MTPAQKLRLAAHLMAEAENSHGNHGALRRQALTVATAARDELRQRVSADAASPLSWTETGAMVLEWFAGEMDHRAQHALLQRCTAGVRSSLKAGMQMVDKIETMPMSQRLRFVAAMVDMPSEYTDRMSSTERAVRPLVALGLTARCVFSLQHQGQA